MTRGELLIGVLLALVVAAVAVSILPSPVGWVVALVLVVAAAGAVIHALMGNRRVP